MNTTAHNPYRRIIRQLISAFVFVCLCFGLMPAFASDTSLGELFANERTYVSLGIGSGHASVNDPENQLDLDSYINERGISLNLRLASEIPMSHYFSIQAGVDVFSSASVASLFTAPASYGGALSAGFIVGSVNKPNLPYVSLSYGIGGVALSDQAPSTGCIVCSGRKGGTAGGPASRIALGMTTRHGARVELVWLRAGGNGNNRDFPEGVDAYLDAFLLAVVLPESAGLGF